MEIYASLYLEHPWHAAELLDETVIECVPRVGDVIEFSEHGVKWFL